MDEAKLRSCKKCGTRHHWKAMRGEKVWVADYCDDRMQVTLRAGTKAEKKDTNKGLHDWNWAHTCA
eukprot:1107115-Lingulodinium_polyedra.AAC.1